MGARWKERERERSLRERLDLGSAYSARRVYKFRCTGRRARGTTRGLRGRRKERGARARFGPRIRGDEFEASCTEGLLAELAGVSAKEGGAHVRLLRRPTLQRERRALPFAAHVLVDRRCSVHASVDDGCVELEDTLERRVGAHGDDHRQRIQCAERCPHGGAERNGSAAIVSKTTFEGS